MDFFHIIIDDSKRDGVVTIYPDFIVSRSSDLMVRGGGFYAVWDEAVGLWSTDEYDVQRLVDEDLLASARQYRSANPDARVNVKTLGEFSTGMWNKFQNYLKNLSNSYTLLDMELVFADQETKKEDYSSKRLDYSLTDGPSDAWDELLSTLYLPSEREKLEWAIGAILAGDAKRIQKFIVIYGPAGGGKSTVLNIIQRLFSGYETVFDAREITSGNNSFATEAFKHNPLIGIQHDGDLSKIKDNTKLNSIISHEKVIVNEKFKSTYSMRFNAFLFMGTNSVVKITDSRAGLIRRLIDVHTSGDRVGSERYDILMSQIEFELGAIAYRCLEVYRDRGKLYYSHYRPLVMIAASDYFYNFVSEHFYEFRDAEHVSLTRAFAMYKTFCDDNGYEYRLPKPKFRTELMGYFHSYKPVDRVDDGKQKRSIYRGFKTELFESRIREKTKPMALVIDREESVFDVICADCKAQYADERLGIPLNKWEHVTTTLSDLDTSKLHYVQVPKDHIVIDFDLKNLDGEKDPVLNFEAAAKLPPTYAELSKSGKGVHLHYLYGGDPELLSRIYGPGIEVKVSVGESAIRRQFTFSNNIPLRHISEGLPIKEKPMLDFDRVQSENGLRKLVERNLRKEIHPGTKPSIDFIHKILSDAHKSNLVFDLTDLRPKILAFAGKSTNQSKYCVSLVGKMSFKSEDPEDSELVVSVDEADLVFFDVEVFPNLLLVSWMYNSDDAKPVRMINPSPEEIGELLERPLVGFNNRRYDNHILYGRFIGYSISDIYKLSVRIIENSANAYFREAFNLSYADIYDFTTKKQSLKMYEVELGLKHNELDLPWDEPVDESLWDTVGKYCDDDVMATRAAFYDRYSDFLARKILSDLSGLTVNDTTKKHTAKLIFGNDTNYKDEFVYTDLSELFPGYTFNGGISQYKGEDPKEGGYVFSEPGMYENVVLLDITSMHPTSILKLNLFGKYTNRYQELIGARVAIKRNDIQEAMTLYDGKLAPYLQQPELMADLAYALKIAINTVYGLTSARFDNPFRDVRNVDNIVAKRGSLFMIELKHRLQERGVKLIHIKTDSVKLVNPTDDDIDFVTRFGEEYGYAFELESIYSKLCLVNNAVYIAKDMDNHWTAVGAEFSHPVVFKSLFSQEEVTWVDKCEIRSVTGNSKMYLDLNEGLDPVDEYEVELDSREKNTMLQMKKVLNPKLSPLTDEDLRELISAGHNLQFVGKVGSFYPIKSGCGGGLLYRIKEGRWYAVTGTKGWRWLESDMVDGLKRHEDIDDLYYEELIANAVNHLGEFGDVDSFIN